MEYRVAALQYLPAFLDKDVNLERLGEWLGAADADLAVLPSLPRRILVRDCRPTRRLSETTAGRSCTLFRDVAVTKRMTVVAGFAERDGDRIYNSAAIAAADGSLRIYRKSHLFAEEKPVHARRYGLPGGAGRRRATRNDDLLRLALSGKRADAGAESAQVIVHPSALVAPPRMWQPVMRARSFENKVFTLTANRIGSERHGDALLTFHGCSQITGINGAVLVECDEQFEGWIATVIDPSRADDKRFSPYNDIVADRRPELYER